MHAHWLHVPTVFLFSAVAASATSFYAPGPPLSVGASGGIMGMIGFLAVVGVRRRHLVPRGFLRSIALSVALTAATGLVAHHFIDNAAHAGGFAGGVLIGFAHVRRGPGDDYRLAPSSLARAAGGVSAVALFVATAGTLFLLLTLPGR
jgi:membrane associated rhomboid family serine protease